MQKLKAMKPPRPTKRELWLREMAERRMEREAQSAALAAMESELRQNYAAEREANRKAYLERKNAPGGSLSCATANGEQGGERYARPREPGLCGDC